MHRLIFIFLIPLNLLAGTLPQSGQEFCERFGQRPEDQSLIQDFANDPENLMAFKNNGGVFNGGVCWWHSRFQRNIFYLSIFRPDLEKPKTTKSMQNLIHQIRLGNTVVTIPGYQNLEEFSRENQNLIQEELNDWQIFDGVVLGGWMQGLKGTTRTNSQKLKRMMDEVYTYVSVQKKIAYQKLQIKGLTSHAWLIVGMKKNERGYDLNLIDSNQARMSEIYSYKDGDTSFYTNHYGHFVPYLEFKNEEEKLIGVGKQFCQKI